MHDLLDYYFWFSQPSSILAGFDKLMGYVSAGLLLAGILLWVWRAFIKLPPNKKLMNKLANWTFTIGLSGLLWFGLRYENTPIFSNRYWFGLVAVIGLLWLLWIFKYLFINFPREHREWKQQLIKDKYLTQSR